MFKIYKLVKRSWWQLFIIIVLVAAQTLLQLMLPDYISNIQSVVSNIDPVTGATGAQINEMLTIGLIMVGLSGLIFALAIGQGLLNSYFVAELGRVVRRESFKTVEDFSLSDINEFGTASLLTRVTNDTRVVQNFAFMINRVFVMSPIFLIIGSIKLLN
ncbi:MAG: ABC transporter transmembrane domain-containing protein, partial [Bacilli bacterium]